MQNGIDRVIEQVAVVAHHQHGVRIVADEALEPDRAFEVEIVGRLVEKQHIGRGEEGGCERHAHAPAARQGRAGAALRLLGEAQARQDCRGAGRCGMGVDIGEPRLDFGDAVRVGRGLRLIEQVRRVRGRPPVPSRAGVSGPPGASCATVPIWAWRGTRIEPDSVPSSPRIMRNSVDLPTPLRPTRPTLWPSGGRPWHPRGAAGRLSGRSGY